MRNTLENNAFLLMLALVTILFLSVIWPFFGAVLWGCILALLFYPMHRWLLEKWHRPNLSALVTLVLCVLIGVLPTLLIIWSFFSEVADLYQQIQSGKIDPGAWLDQLRQAFPQAQELLQRFNISVADIKEQISALALATSRVIARNAMQFGQGALQVMLTLVLMLYLAFFLLRDGSALVRLLIRALPLGDEREELLFSKIAGMTRAMVKGTVIVGVVQGTLGGLMFWALGIPGPLLWGVVMVILSMIPVVGAGLIWGPVAIYLFATGDWIRGIIMVIFGAVIIGLIDNLMRPMLVSRDTKLPDYVVLFSILGGIVLFGLNGFVVGPLTAALFVAFWQIFIREFNTPSGP